MYVQFSQQSNVSNIDGIVVQIRYSSTVTQQKIVPLQIDLPYVKLLSQQKRFTTIYYCSYCLTVASPRSSFRSLRSYSVFVSTLFY